MQNITSFIQEHIVKKHARVNFGKFHNEILKFKETFTDWISLHEPGDLDYIECGPCVFDALINTPNDIILAWNPVLEDIDEVDNFIEAYNVDRLGGLHNALNTLANELKIDILWGFNLSIPTTEGIDKYVQDIDDIMSGAGIPKQEKYCAKRQSEIFLAYESVIKWSK